MKIFSHSFKLPYGPSLDRELADALNNLIHDADMPRRIEAINILNNSHGWIHYQVVYTELPCVTD